jgi:hypothetical protein
MNRIGRLVQLGPLLALAALAALSAGAASAQQRYDPAIPRGVPDQRLEPAGELGQPVGQPASAPIPPRLVQNNRRAQRDADARHCLTLATNREVHRCSLRYRPRGAPGAVVKARAKPSASKPAAAAGIEPDMPANIVKPGAPRPGDTAKAQDLVKPMDVTKPGGVPKPIESTAKAEPPKPPVSAPTAVTPPAKPAAPAAKAPEPAKK